MPGRPRAFRSACADGRRAASTYRPRVLRCARARPRQRRRQLFRWSPHPRSHRPRRENGAMRSWKSPPAWKQAPRRPRQRSLAYHSWRGLDTRRRRLIEAPFFDGSGVPLQYRYWRRRRHPPWSSLQPHPCRRRRRSRCSKRCCRRVERPLRLSAALRPRLFRREMVSRRPPQQVLLGAVRPP